MLKKLFVLSAVLAFFCSPLRAETKKVGPFLIQDGRPSQSASLGTDLSGFRQAAGPQDFCPFTASCLDAALGDPCDLTFGGPGTAWSYQDPAKNCPPAACPTVYPFEVKAVHVLLSNCDPTQSCIMVVTPGIWEADFTDPDCVKPGNQICTGPPVQVFLPPNTHCQEFVIPLEDSCCVDTSYFASITVDFPTGVCNSGICHDLTCDLCCDYVFDGANYIDLCLSGLPGNLAIWTDGLLSCQSVCEGPASDTGPNHYKTWRLQPKPVTGLAVVTDQFMTDDLAYSQIEFLSNPVRKIVPAAVAPNDTFDIVDPDYHLVWYRAQGRDTLLEVEYVNQFESTTVEIDSVKYLLLPAQKIAPIFHNRPDSLDHFKAYRIRDPKTIHRSLGVDLQDQFDQLMGITERIDSLIPRLFLNPAQKFTEPTYDTTTHYLAYEIFPKRTIGIQAVTVDQFETIPGEFEDSLIVLFSDMLLVPTRKLDFGIPEPDTGPNHFKTWRIQPVPFTVTVALEDQFMKDDNVRLDGIEFLSNPVRKIVFDPLGIPDTFNITDPDEHLNWYKAVGKKNYLKLAYQNQFESTTVLIDSLKYLLVPAQKLPHPAPESLDHYKCYRICNPVLFNKAVLLDDQFDLTQEQVTSLSATYFCTPAIKNTEPGYDTSTHYVAYSFAPGSTTNESRTTIDQFGQHPAQALVSELLLVPTDKLGVLCDAIPGDANADLAITLADAISIVNYIFNNAACLPLPLCWLSGKVCRGDTDGSGAVSLADVIRLVNFIFAKPCPTGVPGTTPCCWKPLPSPGSTCCLPVPGCDPSCP